MPRPLFRAHRPDPVAGARRWPWLRRSRAETKTIARCGQGFLEEVDGYRVLHLKGTPYEMGYQQGALLKDDIRELVRFLFEVKAKEVKVEVGGIKLLDPKRAIGGIAATQKKYVPDAVLRGAAAAWPTAAGLDVQDVIAANFIPEMFHCSGFALAARPRRTARSTTAGSSTTAATGGSRSTPS